METISIIVCPNGFGHIRRSCQLYNSLTAAGYKVKIYTDKDQFNDYILSKNITNNFDISNCSWLPIANDYKKNQFKLDEFRNLSEKISNSLIISDNYLEPFIYNKKGILLANFFLHKELLDQDHEYMNSFNSIQWNDINLVTSIFTMPYIKEKPNSLKIPLIGEQFNQMEDMNHLIITKGLGCWSNDFDQKIINYIQRNLFDYNGKIFLDKTLKNILQDIKSINLNIEVTSLNEEIISTATAIIGRPSIGILTESFQYRIPFVAVVGADDKESINNGRILNNLYNDMDINIIEKDTIAETRNILSKAKLPVGGQNHIVKIISNIMQK